jgi:retinol dehydrogenase 14
MKGKVCLVTGATAGIGKATAMALAGMGAIVAIVGRNAAKTEAVAREIITRTGNEAVTWFVADLSRQDEVRRLAAEFRNRYDQLHVLVNNAGGMFGTRQVTADGLELTFALNHLAYFLLTDLLLGMLKASAPARIVNLSSGAHLAGRIHFGDLQLAQKYKPGTAYAQSKLANVLFTYELARRLEGTGVTANCLHPGAVATNFGQNWGLNNFVYSTFGRFMLTPEQGADTAIYLASSPEVDGVTGRYFAKRKPKRSKASSYDTAIAARLWQVSEQLTGM